MKLIHADYPKMAQCECGYVYLQSIKNAPKRRLRAKFINADGGFQYKILDRVHPFYHLAMFPKLSCNFTEEVNPAIAMKTHKRSYEFYGENRNGLLEYREIL